MKKRTLIVAALPIVVLLTVAVFHSPRQGVAQSSTRAGTQAHYQRLWTWLQQHDYRKWRSADGKTPEFQESEAPHGALVKVYVSERAACNLKDLADGSVVVKENYSPDKKLMAVTVMHRSKGYDGHNGDWYYAKYMPDGKIAKTPPKMKSMPIAGKFQSCINCHSGAGGDDFVFFND